ncbi:MAG TPA: hypothetical protein VNT27_11995, partial [Propionibacteriaceae bacterium]|nr:hypothetical protein [Propionibacteriaceae bacterium]
ALIAAVAEHARHVPDAPHRATAIRATAGAWARFRARRLDPHELAWASPKPHQPARALDRTDRTTALASAPSG